MSESTNFYGICSSKKDDIGLVGGELCVSRAYAAIPIKSIIGPLLLLRSSSIHTFPEHGSFQNTRELNRGSDKVFGKRLANIV